MASKVNRNNETERALSSFDDIGWSAIAVAALIAAWFLMSYRDQLPFSYDGLIRTVIGFAIAASLVSIGIGLWRASYYWKLLAVAVALVWLVPFAFYVMSFAGPLFYWSFTW